MSTSNTSAASGCSFGLVTLTGIVFVILKLAGEIDWSWWWVLSPFIFQAAVLLLLTIIFIGVMSFGRKR